MTNASELPHEIRTRTSVYTRRPDGIIVQRTLDGCVQTLDDARVNVATLPKLATDPKHPLLVDMRGVISTQPGVREYYAGPEAMAPLSALAVLVDSVPGRVLGNLYLALNQPSVPTRLFTVELEAITWLLKITKVLAASARRR